MSELPKRQPMPTHDFSLHRARRQDAESIARLLEQAFAIYKPLYTADAYRATVIDASIVRARLDEGPTWIATGDSGVIGTVSAMASAGGLYVRSMAVHPSGQGRGVGRALLDGAQAFARQNGLDRMYLSTTPFLFAAIGLYERFGFRRSGDGPSDLLGTPLFSMCKDLR